MGKAFDFMPVSMLTFQEFKDAVRDGIREKLPEGDYEIEMTHFQSATKDYEGISIFEKGSNLAPTINLNEVYSSSAAIGVNLGEALESIVDTYKFARQPVFDLDLNGLYDYENVKDRITIRLLNGERENPGLVTSAHKELGSFVAAYYISVGEGEVSVSQKMLEGYGVSLDELHDQAVHNQVPVNGVRLNNVLDIMNPEFMMGGTIKGSCLDRKEQLEPGLLYALTSDLGGYGASIILDTEIMDRVADKCDGKMYVIPSSVHEVLIMRNDGTIAPEIIDGVIQDINRNQVKPEEVLGERALLYEKESHSLYYATEYQQGRKIDALKEKSPDHDRTKSLGPEIIQ